jgi:hypothetical protein
MMHAGSIYENQIETFSGVQNQRIDSSNRNLAKRTFASCSSVGGLHPFAIAEGSEV